MCNYLNNYDNLNGWSLHSVYIFMKNVFLIWVGLLWSWSYDSWIYNYLCNQCLSPLKLYSIQHYVIIHQLLVTGLWFSPGTSVPPPIKLTTGWSLHSVYIFMKNVFLIWVVNLQNCEAIKKSPSYQNIPLSKHPYILS
jgi:hypothetical protein